MFIEQLLQQKYQATIWEFTEMNSFPKELTKMYWTSTFLLWRLAQEQNILGFYTLHASFPLECSYCCELQKQPSETVTELISACMPLCPP